MLYIAKEFKYIGIMDYERLYKNAVVISKTISGFIKSIEKRLTFYTLNF